MIYVAALFYQLFAVVMWDAAMQTDEGIIALIGYGLLVMGGIAADLIKRTKENRL